MGNRLEESRNCPECLGKLHRHGERQRLVIHGDTRDVLSVVRYRCSSCGKTVTVLPVGALPHKHYSALTIESTLYDKQYEEESPSTVGSTLLRWKSLYSTWLMKAINMYIIQHLQKHNDIPLPKDPRQGLLDYISTAKSDGEYSFNTTLEYIYWISHPLRV